MDKAASLLNDVRVASPCAADWDEMSGDDQVRSCARCQKKVYNLSEMTADEAALFVRRAEGRVCVRFHRRADGTMLTRDYPIAAPMVPLQSAQAASSARWGMARRAGALGLTMVSAATLAHANPSNVAEKPQASRVAQSAHKVPAPQAQAKASSVAAAHPKTPAILSHLPPNQQAAEPETVPESATSREDAMVPPTVYGLIAYTTQGELSALPAAPSPPVLRGEASATIGKTTASHE